MEKKYTFFCIGILLIITASIPAAETPRDGTTDDIDAPAPVVVNNAGTKVREIVASLYGNTRRRKTRIKRRKDASSSVNPQRLAPGDGGAGRTSDSSGVSSGGSNANSDESGGEEMLQLDPPANLAPPENPAAVPPVPPLRLAPTLPPLPPPPLHVGASAPGTPRAADGAAPAANATPRSSRTSLIGTLRGILTGRSNPGTPRTAPPSMPGTPRDLVIDVTADNEPTNDAPAGTYDTSKAEDAGDDAPPEETDASTPYGSWSIAALASAIIAGASQTAIEMDELAAVPPPTQDDVQPVATSTPVAAAQTSETTAPPEERAPDWKGKGPATQGTENAPPPQTSRGDDDQTPDGTNVAPGTFSIAASDALRAVQATAGQETDGRGEPPITDRADLDEGTRYFSEDADDPDPNGTNAAPGALSIAALRALRDAQEAQEAAAAAASATIDPQEATKQGSQGNNTSSQTAIEMGVLAAVPSPTQDDVQPVATPVTAAQTSETTAPPEERAPDWKGKGPATQGTENAPPPQTSRGDDWYEPPTPHRADTDYTGRYSSKDGEDGGGGPAGPPMDDPGTWRESYSTHAKTARDLVDKDAAARRAHSSHHRHRHRSQASKPKELTAEQQGILNQLCAAIIAYTDAPDPVKLTKLAAQAEELGIINRPITHEDSLPIKDKVADIARHTKFEMTALDIAVMMERPQPECVKILLNHNADPNRKEYHTNRTPLIRFCKNWIVEDAATRPIISMLIKHNAAINLRDRYNLNALHHACGTERDPVVSMAMVQALLARGSTVDEQALYCACTNRRASEELVALLLQSRLPTFELLTKIANGEVRDEIKALIRDHAEAHAATVAKEEAAKQRIFQGLCNTLVTAQYSALPTAITQAAELGLINHRIPPELANPTQKLYAGDTPLILACRLPYPRYDVLRQLTDATAQASTHSTHDGCTALAAFCQNVKILRETVAAIISLLAAKKSLVLKRDTLGITPAIIACAAPRQDGTITAAIIEALIKCYPDLTLAERAMENTAMDVACCNKEIKQGHLPLIRALCPPNKTAAPAYPRDELAHQVTPEARAALQQRDAIARGVRRPTVAELRRAEQEAEQNAARIRTLNATGGIAKTRQDRQ